jgi:hypothetical protein
LEPRWQATLLRQYAQHHEFRRDPRKRGGLEIGHPVPLFTFRPPHRVYRLGLIKKNIQQNDLALPSVQGILPQLDIRKKIQVNHE